jgi:hypothetical protein
MRLAFWRPKPTLQIPDGPAAYWGDREIKMLRTVWSTEGEWLAGRIYRLTDEKADEFINIGYATGDLSREYTADEIARLVNKNQEIRL